MGPVIALLLAAAPGVAPRAPSTTSGQAPHSPSSAPVQAQLQAPVQAQAQRQVQAQMQAQMQAQTQPQVVVVEAESERALLADDTVGALEQVGLRAEAWDPSAFFAAQPGRCSEQLECLCSAPALKASSHVLVLRVSRLSSTLKAVDLRWVDCNDTKHGARLAVVLDAAELVPWVQRFAPRLMLAGL